MDQEYPITPEQTQKAGLKAGEQVRQSLVRLLEQQKDSTSLQALARKLGELATAHKLKVFFDADGERHEEAVPLYNIQLNAVKLIAQILDIMPSLRNQLELPEGSVNLTLNLGGKQQESTVSLPEQQQLPVST